MAKEKQKKDYLKLFVKFCKDNDVHWQICGNGTIDEIYICSVEEDVYPAEDLYLGTKKSYDWLVEAYKQETENRCPHCDQIIY